MTCPNCGADFFHRAAAADNGVFAWITAKPDFPKRWIANGLPELQNCFYLSAISAFV